MSNVRCLTSEAFRVQLINRCRIHVRRRGNGARTATAHICEKEDLAADKLVEPIPGKRVEKSFGVIPIARAVFQPGDRVWITFQETRDQFWCDPDDRHRENMIEINSQTRIANALHHFAEVTVETFFADVLVIK